MSAESPKRAPRLPTVVPPEPVNDRSIIESVTGFINEVALNSAPPVEQKDQIQWVRFETTADVSNPSFGEDYDLETGVPPPLLLILGYKNGVQAWAVPANGEATEVISWRNGIVKCVKVLPTPISSYRGADATETPDDYFKEYRPLMAVVETPVVTPTGPQFCSVNFYSLRETDPVSSTFYLLKFHQIIRNSIEQKM